MWGLILIDFILSLSAASRQTSSCIVATNISGTSRVTNIYETIELVAGWIGNYIY